MNNFRSQMFNAYNGYQRSHYWREVVAEVKDRDNNTCQDCGKTVLKYGTVHRSSGLMGATANGLLRFGAVAPMSR